VPTANPYYQYDLTLQYPPLQKPNGEAYTTARGIVRDGYVEAAIAAVKARWVQTCPEDALPALGDERGMPRLVNETTAQYRARLATAWTIWPQAGTQPGELYVVRLLLPTAYVVENNNWNYQPSAGYNPGDEWWRFWIVVPMPHPFTGPWTWGGGTTWGPSRSWGINGPQNVLTQLRQLVDQWKGAHNTPAHFVFIMSGLCWGGAQLQGGGAAAGFFNWGDGHVYGAGSSVYV
jgi:hypothetical protein